MEWRYPLLGIAEHGLFKSGKRTGSINRNWVDERDNLLENYRAPTLYVVHEKESSDSASRLVSRMHLRDGVVTSANGNYRVRYI